MMFFMWFCMQSDIHGDFYAFYHEDDDCEFGDSYEWDSVLLVSELTEKVMYCCEAVVRRIEVRSPHFDYPLKSYVLEAMDL